MRERYGHSVIALMVACGFLVGVVAAVVLGTQGSSDSPAAAVATAAPARTAPPVARTVPPPATPARPAPQPSVSRMPSVVGERLDAARDHLSAYSVQVEGGGLFGVVVESNWVVVSQSPPPGSRAGPGTPVTVQVARG